MKGLTLTQPWASEIALGNKRVETRSWRTTYRGLIAIHAAKGFPAWARKFAAEEHAIGRVQTPLPLSAFVAVARLSDCLPTAETFGYSALERHLGDYTPGRWAWVLDEVEPLSEPVPCRGALGLWAVPAHLIYAVNAARPVREPV